LQNIFAENEAAVNGEGNHRVVLDCQLHKDLKELEEVLGSEEEDFSCSISTELASRIGSDHPINFPLIAHPPCYSLPSEAP
jgi:hypothetical protein